MTYRCYTLGTVLHLDSAPFSRKPDSELRLIPPSSRQALPYPGPRLHQTRERHLSTSSVMLAMPSNIIRHRLVHGKTKRRFILPHFSYHVVLPSLLTLWQNGFRVCRKQDLRQEQHHERSSILLSLRHFCAGTFHVQLLELCFRPQESEINFVERESTSMVSCVGEYRVRLVRSPPMHVQYTHCWAYTQCTGTPTPLIDKAANSYTFKL